MSKPNFSAQLPQHTLDKIEALKPLYNGNKTQIVIDAINRMYQQEMKTMNALLTQEPDWYVEISPWLKHTGVITHDGSELLSATAMLDNARRLLNEVNQHSNDLQYLSLMTPRYATPADEYENPTQPYYFNQQYYDWLTVLVIPALEDAAKNSN